MRKVFCIYLISALGVSSFAFTGCKAKQQEAAVSQEVAETTEMAIEPITEEMVKEEEGIVETIPPSAAPTVIANEKKAPSANEEKRNREIQIALKNAGFYASAIDGKIGPKTKKAIEEFQASKGLKADGKVGPKTWAELERYLTEGKGD